MTNSRRNFFKVAAVSGLSLLAVSSIAQAEEKRRAKPAAGGGNADLDLPLVEPGKGMAASLNYQHSHADVKDKALKVDRQGLPFEKQLCSGCMLYTAVGKKGKDEVGKCTLFANQLVKANGWCASFSKKA